MTGNLFIKLLFWSIIILLAVFTGSCNKDQDYVPYVPINRYEISLSIWNELKTPGYSIKINNIGYSGVIVFCENYDVVTPSTSVYYAFDATCTHELSDTCSVVNEGNNVKAVCPCCGSEFYLSGGYPYKGEASAALKMYNISILNDKLIIYN